MIVGIVNQCFADCGLTDIVHPGQENVAVGEKVSAANSAEILDVEADYSHATPRLDPAMLP
jgi:hypothetical protein